MAILGVDARAAAASAASGTLVPGVLYNPPSAGSLEQVWVEILDHNLVSQGPVQFVTMTAQLYYNGVGLRIVQLRRQVRAAWLPRFNSWCGWRWRAERSFHCPLGC